MSALQRLFYPMGGFEAGVGGCSARSVLGNLVRDAIYVRWMRSRNLFYTPGCGPAEAWMPGVLYAGWRRGFRLCVEVICMPGAESRCGSWMRVLYVGSWKLEILVIRQYLRGRRRRGDTVR